MNVEKIIRNINISILTNSTLTQPYVSIYNDLENILGNLHISSKSDGMVDGHIYSYKNSDDKLIIMYEDDKMDENIWIHKDRVWSFFRNKYKINVKEVGKLLDWYVKGKLNIGGRVRIGFVY